MKLEKTYFIKPAEAFDANKLDYAPMFRKRFTIGEVTEHAVLSLCTLGCGQCYINGKRLDGDMFCSPVSNYNKTIWYRNYDVTDMLHVGENIIAVWCGNSWFNEAMDAPGDYDEAAWRDIPKMAMALEVNNQLTLTSDDSWKYTLNTPITYNQLRGGEHFDSRLYDEFWTSYDYDDSTWRKAVQDKIPPKGVLRECKCEPICEDEVIPAKSVTCISENKYIFDMGKNISGYIRLKINQTSGDTVTIRYGEDIYPDGSLNQIDMLERFYPNNDFQTDKFICCGKEFLWSPRFAYHGFRYIEIAGINNVKLSDVCGVFVHQAVEQRANFECSNERLNKIYKAGQTSTLSNLFYLPTDCPTRERLGWTNDATASAEQMLINFSTEKVFEKWLVDICDAMREDGALPGPVPTVWWGYDWGSGPISNGALFEIPYRIYQLRGDDGPLKRCYPYFLGYIKYIMPMIETNKHFGLDDWMAPTADKVKESFINPILVIKFLRIAIKAAELLGENTVELEQKEKNMALKLKKKYIGNDGRCTINKQTAVSMMIVLDLYDSLEALAAQLATLIEENNFHHDCGMVGMQYLYPALNKCDLQEYAYKITLAKGYPSIAHWIDNGLTSLCEKWDMTESKNHHMFSGFMAWIVKTIVGICPNCEAEENVIIEPYYFEELSYAHGWYKGKNGKVDVYWSRTENNNIQLVITVFDEIKACYKGNILKKGKHIINIK